MNRKQRRAATTRPGSGSGAAPGAGRAGGPSQTTAMMARALDLHRTGQLNEAILIYQKILEIEPHNADALHLSGVIAHQAGRHEAAETLIGEAIRLDGKRAEFHCNLGLIHLAQKRMPEAEVCFRSAVALKDNYPEAHLNLGLVLHTVDRGPEAVAHYERARALRPTLFEAHANLGTLYYALDRSEDALACYHQAAAIRDTEPNLFNNIGNVFAALHRLEEAEAAYLRALALDPRHSEANNNYGLLLQGTGRLSESEQLFRTSIACRPDYAEAYDHLGTTLQGLGRLSEAEAMHREALRLKPDFAVALNNLGNALQDLGRLQEAAVAYLRALSLMPEREETHSNLGNAFRGLDMIAESAACHRRAITLAPAFAPAHNNLGFVLQLQGKMAEAEASYLRALQLAPDYAEAQANMALIYQLTNRHDQATVAYQRSLDLGGDMPLTRFNQGVYQLERGEFLSGWAGYRSRFGSKRAKPDRKPALPEWTGDPLAGRKLLVWREQGVGDEIMFSSCMADLMDRVVAEGGTTRCVFECDGRLVPLFQRALPALLVRPDTYDQVAKRELLPFFDCDVQIALGDLPALLRRRLSDFPERQSWLTPDPGRLPFWQSRLAELGPNPRIGICWRSGIVTTERKSGYTTLDQWQPILTVPGVHWVNLQYDDCLQELQAAEHRFNVEIARWPDTDLKNDFEAVAALISSLDLVISACTSVGELAAALGVPVWRFASGIHGDWTVMATALRPWYPTQRLFRARPDQSMDTILDEIGRELRSRL